MENIACSSLFKENPMNITPREGLFFLQCRWITLHGTRDFSSYYPKMKKCLPMQESEVFNTIFVVTMCFGNFLKEKYVLLQVVKLAGTIVAKT